MTNLRYTMHLKKKNSGCLLHVREFFLISDQRAFNARLQKKRQNGVELQLVLHKTIIIGFGLYKIAKLSRFGLCYLSQASADDKDLDLNKSCYHFQPYPT